MQNYQKIKEKFLDLKADQRSAQSSLSNEEKTLAHLKQYEQDALSARAIIQNVAEMTQKNLESHISSLVTLAINSVFPEECIFGIEFVQKRNKTEANFYLMKNGNKITDIVGSDGGGLGDIVSVGLRVAFWKLGGGRPILILDEPFRFLNGEEMHENVSEMIAMLSQDLDLQFIVVSDQGFSGDREFRIVNGVVKELN